MSTHAVVCACDATLSQLETLAEDLTDDQYTYASAPMGGGTIGQHLRHTLDHFEAAITTPRGEKIDYDHRDRGTRIESDRGAAIGLLGSLRERLSGMTCEEIDEPVTAHVMCSCDDTCADLKSSRGRELFFAMHHGIHHNAMIKAIAHEQGIPLDEGFGRAPSTVNFETSGA